MFNNLLALLCLGSYRRRKEDNKQQKEMAKFIDERGVPSPLIKERSLLYRSGV